MEDSQFKNTNLQVIPSKEDAKNSLSEVEIGKQFEYIKIHHLKVVCQKNPQEIAKELDISVSKVFHACRWVRANWEVLNTQEYLADAEKLIGERIKEYDVLIEEAKKGEPIIVDGKVLLDSSGAQHLHTDKELIRGYMRDRREYERMLLEIRGLFQKTQIIMQKNPIMGDVNIDFYKDSDKKEIIELCNLYGEPPK